MKALKVLDPTDGIISKLFFEDWTVAAIWDKPPVFSSKLMKMIINNRIKTINNTKSSLSRSFRLLKKVKMTIRKVNIAMAKLISIPTIKQKILAKAKRLKLIKKGITNKPRYKLLN
jgi:hypothetical protein